MRRLLKLHLLLMMPVIQLDYFKYLHYLVCGFILLCGLQADAQTPKSQQLISKLKTAITSKDSIRLYYSASIFATRESKTALSEKYARKALSIAKRTNDIHGQAIAYFCISDCYFNIDQNDSAKYFALKCIEKYDDAGVKGTYYTYALNIIAAYYLDKTDAVNAILYGQKQMDAAIEVKDTASIANSYTMLCAVYNMVGDTKNSIVYAEKAVKLNKQARDMYNRAVVLTNLSLLYMEDKQVHKALLILYEAKYLNEEHFKNIPDMIRSYMFIGECHTANQHYDSAIYYLQKADTLATSIEKPETQIKCWNIFATTYAAKKDYNKALTYLNKSIKLSEETGLVKLYITGLNQKANVLAEMGEHKDALTLYKKYHTIDDSISSTDVQKTIAELQGKYESDKKDQEIAQQQQLNTLLINEGILKDQKLRSELLLKEALESEHLLAQQQIVQDSVLNAALGRENTLKKEQLLQANDLNEALAIENILREADLKNQRLISGLLIAGIISVLLFGIVLLIQYRKQKAANTTIQEQSDKLTFLMKELHHRVKNNLQIISSLLSLQSFRIKDAAASKAVKEGQQRIEAMSLIHQRLYTRDNITEINIREFISDLVDSLQSAYGFRPDEISVQLNISNELMNVDQAIPLSLIVNELVTNAFKYAYEDNDKPELRIRLNKDDDGINLEVADNGKGVNMEEWKDKEGSFGKELIATFVKQLNGYLSIVVDRGTKFKLSIPNAA